MKVRVRVSPRADRDLDEQAAWIAERSPRTARQFYQAAEATFQQLARMPEAGACRDFGRAHREGMRMFRVKGFPNHLLFYRPAEEGIEVLRVLHTARNIAALFEE